MLELDPHLRRHLPADRAFDWLMNCPGTVHRHVKHRRTLEFELGGRRFFIKIHQGCSWREIWRNLVRGRWPVMSAEPEWKAIERLRQAGVPTPVTVGKGRRGHGPTGLESFVVTEALEGMISLETLVKDWGGLRGRDRALLKRRLLLAVADLARRLHEQGMNHRDFYLCHFLVQNRDWTRWDPAQPLDLILIDLHRVQIRARVPDRWRVKDLGGLYFSAMDCGLTRRDLIRFVSAYQNRPWREAISQLFWRRVERNAVRLYGKHQSAQPATAAGVTLGGMMGE